MTRSAAKTTWSAWLRTPVLRTGLLTGAGLSLVMTCALIAANRVPWLERVALERNSVCYLLFTSVMLIPVILFVRSPMQLFASAGVAWGFLTLAYIAARNFFPNLYIALRPPDVLFVYGAATYGLAAVAAWVIPLCLAIRHHPIAHARRRVPDAHR